MENNGTAEKSAEKQTIDTFDWDNGDPENFSFFGEETGLDLPSNLSTENTEEETEEEKVQNNLEIDEEIDEDDFFDKIAEEADNVKKGESNIEIKSSSMVSFLKEKGIIDFELEDDVELTDELAEEILADSFEDKLDAKLEEKLTELPEDAKNLLKYLAKGGNLTEYLENFNTPSVSLTEDLDLEDESNQELVMQELLRQEGYDAEEIAAQLDYFKSSGKLSSIANKKFTKWKSDIQENKKALVKRQEERARLEKQNLKEYKSKLSELVKSDKLNTIKLSAKDKLDLPGYMADKTVKLENGAFITPMQKELYETLQDNENAVVFAKLLKNRKDGKISFEGLIEDLENDIAKSVKNNIRRNKTPSPSMSRTSRTSTRSILDMFGE